MPDPAAVPTGAHGSPSGRGRAGLTIHHLVAQVGLGGYAVVETDEPADLQYLRAAYRPVSFTVAPVLRGVHALAARTRGVG